VWWYKVILALHVDAVLIVHASVFLSLDGLPVALRASCRFQSLGALESRSLASFGGSWSGDIAVNLRSTLSSGTGTDIGGSVSDSF
jgi:hypothetical protein